VASNLYGEFDMLKRETPIEKASMLNEREFEDQRGQHHFQANK
jgi:hypothetical protein